MRTYPWHSETLAQLSRQLADATLPPALALTAAPGWGLGALLNGACATLLELELDVDARQLAHPDLRWVEPEGAVIKIDQIRRVIEFAVQTPQLAPRKVAAIEAAHLMNENAANALLKTLEEPPPNTHIVLATSRWGKLLPTIRSRCRRLQPTQSIAAAQAWLRDEGHDVDEHALALAGYAPLAAVGMADAPEIESWLADIPNRELGKLWDAVSDADLVDWLARWYRVILARLGSADGDARRSLVAFSDELVEVRRQIETSNAANSRLLLERLMVLWRKLAAD